MTRSNRIKKFANGGYTYIGMDVKHRGGLNEALWRSISWEERLLIDVPKILDNFQYVASIFERDKKVLQHIRQIMMRIFTDTE